MGILAELERNPQVTVEFHLKLWWNPPQSILSIMSGTVTANSYCIPWIKAYFKGEPKFSWNPKLKTFLRIIRPLTHRTKAYISRFGDLIALLFVKLYIVWCQKLLILQIPSSILRFCIVFFQKIGPTEIQRPSGHGYSAFLWISILFWILSIFENVVCVILCWKTYAFIFWVLLIVRPKNPNFLKFKEYFTVHWLKINK
jgi:hypothetical protein